MFEFFKKREDRISPTGNRPGPKESNGNGSARKTREEHRLECEKLIGEAVGRAPTFLAKEILSREYKRIIDLTGKSRTIHYSTGQEMETEIKKIESELNEQGIKESILQEVHSSRELMEMLTVVIESGEKSPEELWKIIFKYRKPGSNEKELGETILEELEKNRQQKVA